VVPPSRPPMATLSIDVEVDYDLVAALEERPSARYESESARYPFAPRAPSQLDAAPDSWSRVRCWCSED